MITELLTSPSGIWFVKDNRSLCKNQCLVISIVLSVVNLKILGEQKRFRGGQKLFRGHISPLLAVNSITLS